MMRVLNTNELLNVTGAVGTEKVSVEDVHAVVSVLAKILTAIEVVLRPDNPSSKTQPF
ncbi:MAG: hypothetical protein AB7V32_07050 [Candidatus Berkiella sp.]